MTDLYLRIPPVEGAARAKAEVLGIGEAADQTANKVTQVGTRMGAAFGAQGTGVLTAGVGQSISVASGIGNATRALRDFNTAGIAISGATLLRDVAEMSRNFTNATGAVTGATGAFGALGAIIKAHPILVLSTVIAAIGAAFGAMSGEVREADSELQKIAKTMREIQQTQDAQRSLRLRSADEEAARARQRALIDLQEKLYDPTSADFGGRTQPFRAPYVARALDISVAELQQFRLGLPSTSERDRYNIRAGLAPGERVSLDQYRDIVAYEFRRQQQLEQSARRSADILSQAGPDFAFGAAPDLYGPRGTGGPGFRFQERFDALYGGGGGGRAGLGFEPYGDTRDALAGYGRQTVGPADFQLIDEAEQQRIAQINEQFRQMVLIGEQVGATLGNAFYNALTGAQSLREALAQVAADFARQGLTRAFAGLGGAVAGGFAPTPEQAPVRAPGSG
jgi:hypothetical protein